MSKIKKQGNKFAYYNDNNVCMGRIDIETEKFVGATLCHMELYNHLEEYRKSPEYIEKQKEKLKKSIQVHTENFHRNLDELEKLNNNSVI